MCNFYELKSLKWKQPLNISEDVFLLTGPNFSFPFQSFMPHIWASKSLVPSQRYPVVKINALYCAQWLLGGGGAVSSIQEAE